MPIPEHFQQEEIEENDVFLADEEETELSEYLGYLISQQVEYAADQAYSARDAQNLAGLAFVAGRSYQKEHDQQTDAFIEAIAPNPEDAGFITINLAPRTAGRLIERLLGELD